MARWAETDVADIGYKIKRGDWVVMTTPFGMSKAFRVTKTTIDKAICERDGRDAMKFPRYFTSSFQPLEKKAKSRYSSPNTWSVRVNPNLSHLRLRYD